MKEEIAWIWLHELRGLALSEKKQLLEIHKTPHEVYSALAEGQDIDLSLAQAEIIYLKNMQHNIRVFTIEDAQNAGFDTTHQHWPLVIYYLGKPPVSHAVALIGTRDLSSMGYYFVHEVLEKIKGEDYGIYAGFASGVERVAIEGAQKYNINTAAILTHGLDTCYPKYLWRTMERLAEYGTLISPFPVGSTPNKYAFVFRNQLLALMTKKTILVEASLTSNSLTIAHLAHELGRSVYAIKGPHKGIRCSGNNELLKRKIAQPIDVRLSQEMSLHFQHKIAQRLKVEPMSFDQIIETFGKEYLDLTNLMLMLEHKRVVSLSSTGKWVYNGW